MDGLDPVPFEEAIAWAKERGVVLPEIYYGELQGLARSLAFSVAGLASIDQLQGVLDSVVQATASGESFQSWLARIESGEIKLDLPRHRLENIFRTNIQSHYARGRCQQHRETLDTHPWFMYDAVNDSRTRPAHAAMDGFVARYDDPIWKIWDPPNGYQCRCRKIALTERQSFRFRDADQRRQENPEVAQARADAVMGGPDKGWDYSICEDPTAGLRKAIAQKRNSVAPALANALMESPPPTVPDPHKWLIGDKATLDEIKALGKDRYKELTALVPPGESSPVSLLASVHNQAKMAQILDWWQFQVLEELAKVRPLGGTLPITNKSGKGVELTKRVAAKLPSDWIRNLARKRQGTAYGEQPYTVIVNEKGRGYHNSITGKIGTDSGSTAEHEWIHAIQSADINLDDLFQTEHKRRTAGDPVEILFAWLPDETGRPDQYVDRYAGREYKNGRASEVMTVVYQALLGRGFTSQATLLKMMKHDKDMLHLALGALFHYVP